MSYNKSDYINDLHNFYLPEDECINMNDYIQPVEETKDEFFQTEKGLYLLKKTKEINSFELLDKISLKKIIQLMKKYNVPV
jgi:hypothetical protein